MNLQLVRAAVENGGEAVDALLADDETVFWVDWRQEDETIADDCEAVLRTGKIRGERTASKSTCTTTSGG